jgi:2-hydroxychromene-2-carboxylate isomerase
MITFWFDFASTYAHLAAQRVAPLAAASGVPVRWRPFMLGPIFAAQGWTTSPFNLYPAKGRAMWRDVERLSARAGLPLKKPEPFPANSLLAARVAIQGQDEPWMGDYVRATFRAEFCEGANISDQEVVRGILTKLGLDPRPLIEAARGEQVKAKLKLQTDEAQRAGVFGAPTFIVEGELFWGNDRLEDAIAWSEKPWA